MDACAHTNGKVSWQHLQEIMRILTKIFGQKRK